MQDTHGGSRNCRHIWTISELINHSVGEKYLIILGHCEIFRTTPLILGSIVAVCLYIVYIGSFYIVIYLS